MLHLTTDYSAQISALLDKLISSGVELGERLLGALIIFIIPRYKKIYSFRWIEGISMLITI